MIPFRRVALYWCDECQEYAAKPYRYKRRRKGFIAGRGENQIWRQMYRCRKCRDVFSRESFRLNQRMRWPKEVNVFGMRPDIWRAYTSDLRRNRMNWTTYTARCPLIAEVLKEPLQTDALKPPMFLGDEQRTRKAA